ncbi:hypothetical protein SLEP1_g19783 [Rubroshorea leprosula]|uniref:Uncharacterized protein n=1 Tax=Rubroshorea leprosula TaxID=152421 RepID=A0AAV5J9D4_9ROSI|nr:hypothetical protein SLEP1_g19783 [Rubroshorea leprosula]
MDLPARKKLLPGYTGPLPKHKPKLYQYLLWSLSPTLLLVG